jgi:mono/diheme cytochrome c family protein
VRRTLPSFLCLERGTKSLRGCGSLFAGVGVALVFAACTMGWTHLAMTEVHASSKGDKKAGAALFHESGCEHCHGVDARGTPNAPDLSTVGKRLSPEQIEHQVREGGLSMPAFGDALQPDQIADLVAFLREKKKAPKAQH